MLELSKGRLTTDSRRHSGEGIFFTSMMFDYFMIGSNNLGFSHNAGADDWLIQTDTFQDPGTLVVMKIGAESERTPKEVFDMFARPEEDDYSFSRTHVPLKLASFGTEGLVSRSAAKRVLSRFEGFKEVLLDFEGIESIGQAFADEIFRVFKLNHPEISVIAIRTNEPVQQMINRAISRDAVAGPSPLLVPTTRALFEEVRAGRNTRAMVPVPAGRSLTVGDRVVFAEATFDPIGIPTFVPNGDSILVVLTKAEDTGGTYGTMRIFGIGWDPVPAAGPGQEG